MDLCYRSPTPQHHETCPLLPVGFDPPPFDGRNRTLLFYLFHASRRPMTLSPLFCWPPFIEASHWHVPRFVFYPGRPVDYPAWLPPLMHHRYMCHFRFSGFLPFFSTVYYNCGNPLVPASLLYFISLLEKGCTFPPLNFCCSPRDYVKVPLSWHVTLCSTVDSFFSPGWTLVNQ